MAMPSIDLLKIPKLTEQCELSMTDFSEPNTDDVVLESEDPRSDQSCKDFPPLQMRSRKVNTNSVGVTTSRKEVSNVAPGTRDVVATTVAEPFDFFMRVPRLDDECIQEQINLAKLQLEEKTRLRDSIQVQIQEKRANTHNHGLDHESAKDEVRKARNLVKLKVKQLHAESLNDLGSEENRHVKILRNELQILKESIVTAAAAASEAEKKRDAEDSKIKQLIGKSRAANDARQAAFVRLQNLKRELSAKNQQFFQYKDDAAAANDYFRSGNKEALYRLCTNQVERVMELWNANDEFRRDYVNSNTKSTIRRLGTLDGRSLLPGEKPPVLPGYPHKRVDTALKTRTTVTPDDNSPERRKEDEDRNVPTQRVIFKKLSEVELTKKAEEMLRMEEAEAKLKELRLKEELAKAEVAREKEQKRQAELERKEAEEKEKERQRRLRKKEKKKIKKKAASSNSESTSAETSNDVIDDKGDESTVVSIPPSLRNRNCRKLMWTGLISLFVYVLFWLGSVGVFSSLSIIN